MAPMSKVVAIEPTTTNDDVSCDETASDVEVRQVISLARHALALGLRLQKRLTPLMIARNEHTTKAE